MTVSLMLGAGSGPESDAGHERANRDVLASALVGAVIGVAIAATPVAATPRAEPGVLEGHRTVTTTGSAFGAPGIDSALAGAWRRHGCAVNPGNPACLTIGLAAACARDAATPGCDGDRDGDRCTDVAEVLVGFDPFNGADCLGNRDGAPAINCLFPAGNLPCDAIPGLAPREVDAPDCGIAIDVERALHPRNPYGCATPVPSPQTGCAVFDRDPTCDGFARRSD
jgi:hypothetical protein